MKVLITGFDPFGGESVNPAYEAVKMLPDEISGAEIVKLEIPTEFVRSGDMVCNAIDNFSPDVVINVGQAGGRSCVTVEKVAINCEDARVPDNAEYSPHDVKVKDDGPDAYFATLPVVEIVKETNALSIPCEMSYTAGTYVCNSVMYNVLHYVATKGLKIKAGFIHVPYAAEQAVTKKQIPYMKVQDIADVLKVAIKTTVESM